MFLSRSLSTSTRVIRSTTYYCCCLGDEWWVCYDRNVNESLVTAGPVVVFLLLREMVVLVEVRGGLKALAEAKVENLKRLLSLRLW